MLVHDLLFAVCLLGFRDQWLDVSPQRPCFREGGNNTLVLYELARQVLQEGLTVRLSSTKIVDFVSVSHCDVCLKRYTGQEYSVGK
jgi:hypothetical protein